MTKPPTKSRHLTEADVQEFRRLVLSECGYDLEMAEAWECAGKLLAIFRAMVDPIPEMQAMAD